MAIAEDSSTPGLKTSETLTALTSNSFTPPSGSLVIVMASWGYTIDFTSTSFTCSSSDGGTWTTGVSRSTSGGYSVYLFYRYYATSPGAITVTTTVSAAGGGKANFQDVRVLTGAASSQAGAATASALTTGTADNTSITTTTVDSVVYGLGNDQSGTSVLSPVSNFSTINVFDSANPVYIASGKRIATVTPGSVTVGWTGSTNTPGAVAFFEVLPTAGPVTKNGSDTGSLADTATVKVQPTGDTGTFTDNATVIVQGTDAGAFSEAASAGEMVNVTDSGTFTDTASVSVATDNFVTDSGTFTDNAFVTQGAIGTDSGSFAEDASVIMQASDQGLFFDTTTLLNDGYLVAARVKVVEADNRVLRVTAEERVVEFDAWEEDS